MDVARYAVAWERPMAEILDMTQTDIRAMDQAYDEMSRAVKRAAGKRKRG